MKELFKIYLMRLLARLFYVFPIHSNRVVLTAYNGRQYSCSPKYIAEVLPAAFDVYFALIQPAELGKGVKYVRYKSFKHFYYLMTAKYLVVNSSGFTGLLPLRKNQILINTWHGYPFKSIGNTFFSDKISRTIRGIAGNNTTYFLSCSESFSNTQADNMSISANKFLNIGLPRDDIYFNSHPEICNKVRFKLGIPTDKRIVLFAPTYRDGPVKSINDYDLEALNTDLLVNTLKQRFGKSYVIVFKAHHDMIPDSIGDEVVNASDYHDIQELLYTADILITDYSSCMWDFALQHKPCFLYTPDLEAYSSVHPFSIEIKDWPYQYACSNEELNSLVINFDQTESNRRIDSFLYREGNYDNGHCNEFLVNNIFMT